VKRSYAQTEELSYVFIADKRSFFEEKNRM
jgi:hypothetical protein